MSRWSAGFGELREAAAAARDTLASADGRWAVVSTSLTATIAGAVAWLAMAAAPPSNARYFEPRREQAALPYELLVRLSGTRPTPGIASEDAGKMVVSQTVRASAPSGANDETLDNALATERAGVATPDMPNAEVRTLTVDPGDNIASVLTDAGVAPADAQSVMNAVQPVFSQRNLRAGQTLSATFSSSDDETANGDTISPVRLLALSFSPSVEHQIVVRLTPEGTYTAQDVEKKLEAHYRHAAATIDSSLYLAAMQAGIPADVVVEMIHMFSYTVDFQRDVHPGDSFELFFNGYYTPEGQPVKNGDIIAATMILDGKRNTLYRHETAAGIEYFDAFGRSPKSMLMKTPIDGARITSGFGMRLHPILGYTRMHKGIDFAAPIGTPVMSAGSGTVMFVGVEHGYGNFVLVDHGNGYSTAYAHLLRFSRGLHPGIHVRQGQTIAYVGATGETTGPHLHYEIRVNNAQVNPLRVKIAAGQQLRGKELRTFLAERTNTDELEASIPLQKNVAEADDLRRDR